MMDGQKAHNIGLHLTFGDSAGLISYRHPHVGSDLGVGSHPAQKQVRPGLEFGTVFIISLVIVALVTFLWSLIGHGVSVLDWETSFTFAILFGILLPWTEARETSGKIVHLYGTLLSNVPDYNGSQIQVDRIEEK